MAFDKALLTILACPLCKGKLILNKDNQELVCRFDKLAYPVRENIPILLENESRELTSDELEEIKG
ncbi:Trm112 family protein [Neptunicella sp.]|uniref:Trm112 family protein n=1 Tax=Neptunicella sp. TaxID=2125986 RepID=UPI003F6900D5